ncbi:hypothetical protein [Mumia sp. DW29H23]|uniref:hypothetical protein n=1 Tax=Mumia sp. DW29H23 TaxID=3421241 RepID=UPI003D693970
MAVTIASTATENVSNLMPILHGTAADVTAVGVFHTTNPATTPTVDNFVIVTGVPSSDGKSVDIQSLIGPRDGDLTLAVGEHQRWLLVKTATEDIIRKAPDTVKVI